MQYKPESFLKLPCRLLWCDGYIDENNLKVKMNLSDKIVYAHIKNRYQFFKGLGNQYFDSQQTIADVCNLDVRSVNTIIRNFEKNGIVVVLKKSYGRVLKNIYTFIRDLTVWKRKPGEKKNSPRVAVDYESFLIPEGEFINDLPDIGYSKEEELDIDNFDVPGWSE